MSKVSIIGAGNVGATAAQFIAMKEIADEVVLVDVKDGFAEGKAIDTMQSLFLLGSKSTVKGYTKNYEPTKDSDIIVITSGMPRKPGMTREELVGVNSGIVKSVLAETYKYSPNAIYVIVSNPMDTMTYLSVKYLQKLGKEDAETKVIGMGGLVDTARFLYYQSTIASQEIDLIDREDADGFVIGGHGDTTMVPIATPEIYRKVSMMDAAIILDHTKRGGAILTQMLGTSAWQCAGAAISRVVEDILGNFTFAETPQSVYREEYDACIGSMVTLSREGVLDINAGEWEKRDDFNKSLEAVKAVNRELGEI